MADTPNNDLEKQLRDYAQQRRDAAGTPEMHPATRAMLQAEVKQRCGKAGAAPASAQRIGWARFWPRLAFAFGVIAILGVAAILIVPPGNKAKEQITLAKLAEPEPARTAADKFEAAPTLAPAALPTASAPAAPATRAIAAKSAEPISASLADATDGIARRDAPAARRETAKSFKVGTEQNAPKESPALNSVAAVPATDAAKWGDRATLFEGGSTTATGSFAGRGGGGSDQPVGAVSSMAKAAAPAMNKPGKAGPVMVASKKAEAKDFDAVQTRVAGEGQNSLTQRYRNVAVMEKQKQSAQLPVLDEFTVAQNGEDLTIVDRDGSVYNGYARLAPADRQTANVDASSPIQLVPNSGGGGRAGATLNQNAMNRAYEQTQAPAQANAIQNSAVAQTLQMQNAIEPQNYFFRVEGTNRSLNQRVVLTGNILQNNAGNNFSYNAQNLGNNQSFRMQQNAPQGNQLNFNNGQQVPAQYNSINGRVQLGEKKASEFNALSVGQ